jgi:hypothetical protein
MKWLGHRNAYITSAIRMRSVDLVIPQIMPGLRPLLIAVRVGIEPCNDRRSIGLSQHPRPDLQPIEPIPNKPFHCRRETPGLRNPPGTPSL